MRVERLRPHPNLFYQNDGSLSHTSIFLLFVKPFKNQYRSVIKFLHFLTGLTCQIAAIFSENFSNLVRNRDCFAKDRGSIK